MVFGRKTLLTAGLFAVAAAGCSQDKPERYAEKRPDPGTLVDEDRGLESKDVLAASDQMAHDLLTNPRLNASRTQWTMAVGHFEDMTRDKSFDTNFDIFIERLRSELSEKGEGRITLIENKENFHAIRDSELEGPAPDKFGQGPNAGGACPRPAINPDYILYGKAIDMPNRTTNFYELQFDVFNTQTREQVWSRHYEVKVLR